MTVSKETVNGILYRWAFKRMVKSEAFIERLHNYATPYCTKLGEAYPAGERHAGCAEVDHVYAIPQPTLDTEVLA
jgi:hypothetical protein